MSENLQKKTLTGVIWSSIDRFSMQGIQFVLSIIIARQLAPSDYGVIAMLAIFLALAQAFIDSGFSNALIQKQNRTDIDYSTVFFFNIGVGIVMYGLLVLCAPLISSFYDMPLLNDIIKWVGLNLIVTSFATVQRAKLTIELDFKRQAIISIVSILLSGCVSVWMAYSGYGVWTLVASVLVGNIITTVLLWWSARWTPCLAFSIDSFKELFGFGSKLLAGGLIHIIYKNLYTLIIGKMFPVSQLGAYNKAYTISQYPSSNLTGVLTRVTYPIECKAQDDNEKLYSIFARIIKISTIIIFPLMIGLCAVAKPFVGLLLTDKWLVCVPYLRIMCIAFMWDPIMRLCWDILNVKHRSDYSLKSEIWKKIVAFILLFASVPFGIKAMCVSLLVYSIADIFVVTQFTKRIIPQISFSHVMQLISPCLLCSAIMGCIVYAYTLFISSYSLQLFGGILIGICMYVLLVYLICKDDFIYLTSLLKKIIVKK